MWGEVEPIILALFIIICTFQLPFTNNNPHRVLGTVDGLYRTGGNGSYGLEGMVDRADYPPAAFLDVKQADGSWQTWFVGATLQMPDVHVVEMLYYTYDDRTQRHLPMAATRNCETGEQVIIFLEKNTAPALPDDVTPVYVVCAVLGDDDLTSKLSIVGFFNHLL